MTYPKVLITTYHQAFVVKGGGEYEMLSVADALKQKGLIVDIYSPYSRSLDSYDTIIHFSVDGGGLELLKYASSIGKNIVLWPNVWLQEKHSISYHLVEQFVDISNVILFKSISELDNFCSFVPTARSKCELINFGASPSYLKETSGDLFSKLYKLKNYAIWFGIIEESKNQLNVIEACRNKGINLVVVGDTRQADYIEKCKKVGGEFLTIIPSLPYNSQIVRSALNGALFYIEVGQEPPGLSAIEAGLTGAKLLLGDSSWAREFFGENAIYVDPSIISSIESGIDDVFNIEKCNKSLVESLKKYCLPESLDPLLNILKKL